MRHAQTVQLADVLAAELVEQIAAHQLVSQRREHSLFEAAG